MESSSREAPSWLQKGRDWLEAMRLRWRRRARRRRRVGDGRRAVTGGEGGGDARGGATAAARRRRERETRGRGDSTLGVAGGAPSPLDWSLARHTHIESSSDVQFPSRRYAGAVALTGSTHPYPFHHESSSS